ncbi:MAG: hypothetical protein EA379_06775 [Phycisphaerales bacterium]|nr:MAG: hypothetical protein EA379_06775 [Phycisphaerales bacterium]
MCITKATTAMFALAGAALASPCTTHKHADACVAGPSERSALATSAPIAFAPGSAIPEVRTKRQFLDDVERGYELTFPLFAACFDENSPPRDDILMAIEETIYGLNQRYQIGARWPGSQGTQITLTWSLIPDGVFIPAAFAGEPAGPSELFSRMDSIFTAQGGRATWIARMESVYERWSQLSGITFNRITVGGNDWDDGASWGSSGSSTRGQMRVAMRNIDGGGGTLAYNFFPGSGNGGNMVMDRSENWGNSSNTHRFLRNVVSHEVGHGIGFNHNCPQNGTKLMEPGLNTNFDGPRHDEIRAVHRNYGDAFTPNNTTALAHDIGSLSIGQVAMPCTVPTPFVGNGSLCSIDRTADVDFFRFEINESASLSVTLSPVGFTYNEAPQNANGSCPSGTAFNSLTVANIGMQILTSGGSVIGSASSNPAGQSEQIDINLFPGTYFVRVFQTGSITQSQLYSLALSIEEDEIVCPGDITGDNIVDFNDLSLVLGQFGQSGPGLQGDVNGDGQVDFTDLSIVLSNFGLDCN